MFKWAADEDGGLIPRRPRYGGEFDKTSKAEKRHARRKKEHQHGERKFSPEELARIFADEESAKSPIRAFILLALNTGMNAADIGQLEHYDIRKEDSHVLFDNDRGKTKARRKTVLWPETVAAMRRVKKGPADGPLFVTLHGNPWHRHNCDPIQQEFEKVLTRAGVRRAGLGFGAFRHTHVSAVGSHSDLAAARLVRAHTIQGIEESYDFPDLARIKAVTDLARQNLLLPAIKLATKLKPPIIDPSTVDPRPEPAVASAKQ